MSVQVIAIIKLKQYHFVVNLKKYLISNNDITIR